MTACAYCGAEFVPASTKQRFCGATCRYTARDRGRGHLPLNTPVRAVCVDCCTEFAYVKFRKPRKRCPVCSAIRRGTPVPDVSRDAL
jgi:hypothetical protein